MTLFDVLAEFQLDGRPLRCAVYGNGHINRTWRVETDAGDYILQKINEHVFPDVPLLMDNIVRVTRHLRGKCADARATLEVVATRGGSSFFRVEGEDAELSGAYRAYRFIGDSLCLERAESAADFRESGRAFGEFQMMLQDFPAETLRETLVDFHNTPARCMRLREAIDWDVCGRAREVAREIDYALQQAERAGEMLEMRAQGALPLRVTHNDTKLNNVLLDARTRRALCVIDLDTVMPGLSGNDFGDSIRFGASTAAEDERDLEKVALSMPLLRAYAEGFLSACGAALTPAELETLPLAAKLMTYECGVRFLTDYLEGDVYFRIHRPGHNLDRARTQFKLAQDMDRQRDEMWKLICELSR